MLAILALICFVLATFNVSLAGLNLVAFGLAFLSVHLLWPIVPWRSRRLP
jgi:hypothetical protein